MRQMGLRINIIGTTFIVLLVMISLAGCKPDNAAVNADMAKSTVRVDNFDFTGRSRKATIIKNPQKIIVCGGNAVDTLLAFGAKNAIHTVVLTEPDMLPGYKKVLQQSNIYPAAISQEAALTIKPDFILGMRRFFDGKVLGDTPFWENNGVSAYIQDASGPIPSLGNFPPCTIESEKTFLRNMGKVFGKEEFAESVIRRIDEELKNVPENVNKKPRILFIEFMPNNIEAFGKGLLSGDIVEKLGGEIISYKAPFISMEELLTVQADVVFLVHHGGEELAQVAVAKMHEGALKNIKAVKEKRVYTIPYDRIVATGIHTPETIRLIREGMYPKE